MSTLEENLLKSSKIDLSYAAELLKRFDSDTLKSNPILRVLNGEPVEQVAKATTDFERKQAYRQLARITHPDTHTSAGPDEALLTNRLFILVADAFRKLSTRGDLPVALDLSITYYSRGESYPPTGTYAVTTWMPDNGEIKARPVWASRNPKADHDAHPGEPDRQFVLLYGRLTWEAHEWNLAHLAHVEFSSIFDCLEMELPYWHPVNRSIEGLENISTSIMRTKTGGLFIIPTVIAAEYQQTGLGRLSRIVDIYTSRPSTRTDLVPADIVASGAEMDLRGFGDEVVLQAWNYVSKRSLDALVREYKHSFLGYSAHQRLGR